ncbi:MAG: helix-turn-helix domain-containing protein [Erysipelotrichaceae bacterium]|nr:helix-turn-helix domain-containing protein [Clostridia bacterium]MBQ6217666.1 helix-turn-helix domain-containing protein [Erysipelotrichaceae bacterium]
MISYKPFYKTLKKKGISQYLLRHMGISPTVLTSIRNGRSISLYTLNRLCLLLNCKLNDIVKYTRTEEEIEMLKKDFVPTHRVDAHKKKLKSDKKMSDYE